MVAAAAAAAADAASQNFSQLVNPEDGGSEGKKNDYVQCIKCLRLKHALEWRKINDEKLAQDRSADGQKEELVREKADGEDGLCLGSSRQCVEHVEEHETSERHSGISWCFFVIDRQFCPENPQSSSHNNEGGNDSIGDQLPINDWFFHFPGRLLDDIGINRFHS